MFMTPTTTGDSTENQTAEGLWWTPFPGSDGFIALNNTSKNFLTAVIQTFGARGNALDSVTQVVAANATRFLALKDVVNGGPRAGWVEYEFRIKGRPRRWC